MNLKNLVLGLGMCLSGKGPLDSIPSTEKAKTYAE